MNANKNWLRRGGSVAMLLVASGAWAEEPQAPTAQEVVEEVVEQATEAAQSIAAEAAAEAQQAAAAIAGQAAAQAEAAATEAAGEAAKAVNRFASKAGISANLTPGPYQIDLSLLSVPAALAAQLKLDGKGALVDRVEKGGAAEAAGIKPHDVLVAVNGQPISSATDAARAVRESEGQELKFELLRAGETINVTIKPRATGKVTANLTLPAVEIDEEIIELESKIREKLKKAGVDVRMQLIRPAHVMPPNTFVARPGMALPEGVSITVRRKGSEPTEIEVTRGDEEWSIRGDKLDELPEDLRPFVSQALGRGPFSLGLQFEGPKAVVAPLAVPKDVLMLRGQHDAGDAARAVVERQLNALAKQAKLIRSQQDVLLDQLNHRARQQEDNLKAVSAMVERLSKQIEKLAAQAEKEQAEEEVIELPDSE